MTDLSDKKSSIAKESLFNEVKGSLFEFLVGQNLARHHKTEKEFLDSIDKNYVNVLMQQDRMVRQFYPEMGTFLRAMGTDTVEEMKRVLGEVPQNPKLMGKLVNSAPRQNWHEADLIVDIKGESRPVSLKLNKKGAFVNTKSGGIKSFFKTYFPFLEGTHQENFNQLVDMEFERMSREVHAIADVDYPGDFSAWVKAGNSELPGELPDDQRGILKEYYARMAKDLHRILSIAQKQNPKEFQKCLAPLMGFSSPEILQVVCFHDFKKEDAAGEIYLHDMKELDKEMKTVEIKPFHDIASAEVEMGNWTLQIRIKPMNKFTTTAIKINCSVKVKK